MNKQLKPSLKQKISQKQLWKPALIVGLVSMATVIILSVFGVFSSKETLASGICDETITTTVTLSSPLTCSEDIKVEDDGILYIEAALTLSADLEVKDGGTVVIRNGGSLTITNGKELKVEGGIFEANGNVSINEKLEIKDNSTFTLAQGYSLTVSDEFKVDDATVSLNGNTTVGGKFEFKDDAEVNIAGIFIFNGSSESKITEGAELTLFYGAEFTMNGSGKLKTEDNDTKITINPGAYFLFAEAEMEGGDVINNGYMEHTSNSKNAKIKTSITGDGVFYVKKKSKIKLEDGAKLHGYSKGSLSDDQFVVGSDTIRVLRLPKFKIDYDGLLLGDSLRIEDTLNLNGRRIDIETYDFRMPKSQSFNRAGNTSEYIQTTSSGKYRFKISKNNTMYTAPIGRNPYLPVMAECLDCEGVEFAVSVSQGVYENPQTQSNQQSSNAVGETWSITPLSSFTGTITFQLQWNAGAAGTVNSELSGFDRNVCTPVYWMSGSSTSWTNDGTNINVAANGSDPYFVSITLTGMTGGTEYFMGVGSGSSVLPVEFLYFKADALDDRVQLSWGTAMEENNEYFTVERSTDGITWQALGEVKGAGTTLIAQDYNLIDYSPNPGRNYYRIRQHDLDGKSETSDVKSIVFGDEVSNTLAIKSVYPNPFDNELTIEYTSVAGQAQFQLLSTSGSVVSSTQHTSIDGQNNYRWNLAGVQPGQYILQVISDKKQATYKVIKK